MLVDDEPDILRLLEITLARMNLSTLRATNLADAYELLRQHEPDLCLTDMKLPDGNGMSLIEHIQTHYPTIPVAMITAHGSVEAAIDALKLGAFDFVSKPIALEKLRDIVNHALQVKDAGDDAASDQLLVGDTPAMERLRLQIQKVARSQAPVHIHGESGVGKEVVARLIHQLSPRAEQPFIAVNCGAIPADLVESELFGHKKGSFTGAAADKPGLFQAAAGGTLLLDEVADLPLNVQVKLLRVIQEKAVRPVGAQQEVPTDVRLLSATHKDLSLAVRDGHFRDDLFYRINVIAIDVPSLRKRREDIPLLATHLLQRIAMDNGSDAINIDTAALTKLCDYDFPGNVRELENILARAHALADGGELTIDDIQFQTMGASEITEHHAKSDESYPEEPPHVPSGRIDLSDVNGDLESFLNTIEREVLDQAMLKHRWNKTAAAKALGISFRSLRYRLKKLGLED
ncbi:two component, sigma54 specific, transcriptional regulator, Fis family [Luminiphilus syltensis NOR5-1B]|uniref:Two component, sigma54 specific, transcriptional regulator, Fis family n=1 Tax=Luminiphilus syltensis NOR5-1B TaxID=565045 RepID=B8KX17_9GAMM|nr:two component, sigma54 specific, transcriptional regulator, Fis family [Luminiphilus syltensis NOR5-1B]